MGLGRLISQHTEEIKSQFVCAFIHACIYHYMRNLTQNLVATSYSQFYLVSYHTQKPHLDNFNLYHPVKMFSPHFLQLFYDCSQSLFSAASASEPNASTPQEYLLSHNKLNWAWL